MNPLNITCLRAYENISREDKFDSLNYAATTYFLYDMFYDYSLHYNCVWPLSFILIIFLMWLLAATPRMSTVKEDLAYEWIEPPFFGMVLWLPSDVWDKRLNATERLRLINTRSAQTGSADFCDDSSLNLRVERTAESWLAIEGPFNWNKNVTLVKYVTLDLKINRKYYRIIKKLFKYIRYLHRLIKVST